MIDLYYAPTPNGWKIAIMLEECALDYRTILVNLPKGEQFDKEFLSINPNAKIPTIVDHYNNGQQTSVFESGAILLYLSIKADRFGCPVTVPHHELLEWLFWQSANLGPMGGQLSHFMNYSIEKIEYALDRYRREYRRCISVLESRLLTRDYILTDYSIADMMIFPWVFIAPKLGVDLDDFPKVRRWRSTIKSRPAVRRAIDLHKNAQFTNSADVQNSPLLFNRPTRDCNE